LATPASVYNNLKHIDEVEPLNDSDLKNSLLFPDNFGLSLLHRHFYLNKGECVVTVVGETKWMSYVTEYDQQ